MVVDLMIMAVLLMLSAFFSGSETACMAVDRIKLRQKARSDRRAQVVRSILRQPEKLIATLLFCNNLVNVGLSAIGTALAIRLFGPDGVLIATVLVTVFLLIFSEITPKTIAAYYPNAIAMTVAPVMRACIRLFYPLVRLLTFISNGIIGLLGVSRPTGRTGITEEEIAFVIKAGAEEGALDDAKQDMLLGVLSMERVLVGDIMKPLRDVVALPLNASYDQVFQTIQKHKYARYPVYEKDPGNAVGFIHALDFLLHARRDSFQLKRLLRKPHFVPELRTIGMQLVSFKKEQAHLSLVVDEYGNVVGIVTMEDILEEIVGEIEDEHDLQPGWIRQVSAGRYSVDGRVLVRDFNRWLKTGLPADEVRTLGGLVQRELGRIPRQGDSVRVGPCRLTVQEMRGKSVTRLVVEIPQE
ncbi:Mg2+ and Co2+ transporter CorB, contains DUF21, CBS pair, and CorC-HlyC domains [Desulfacinum hydrothermale DSM 13146]|uniref:Mg2+ and Co2+ transporter CorB, contains DUF21, CBS pair, and CorC-HlyC domains n=1 Tax=Desulfacinum hydrothermale DSM 13146 TaxID=1121390 RepID=A0A1W1XAR3_9BACT|nr:CNNM domain-containing protein [Desulfacinum hydrothermale]SMC20940.1 Mg2+ and Co2+ transporter CorB, contains DUF21, CBS pair, and CorC-HlyC domains [Desulfacinum hydrothermale DSM 13146]